MTTTVNMLEAKTQLSKLVKAVETGAESEIILTRDGVPVAKIVPLQFEPQVELPQRIGLAEGKFGDFSLEEFDADNETIATLFYDEPVPVPSKRKKSA
jgi:prevent-host-death family protein